MPNHPSLGGISKKSNKKNNGRKMNRGGARGRGGGRSGMPREWLIGSGHLDNSNPEELFPSYEIPLAAPPTEREKREVASYIEVREEIRQGPFYTKSRTQDSTTGAKTYRDSDAPSTARNKPDIDPFVGVPTYSMKYERKMNTVPQLSDRPFNKELFPKELWSTLEGEEGQEVRKTFNRAVQKRTALMDSLLRATSDMTAEERKKNVDEKLKNMSTEDDVDGEVETDDDDREIEPDEEDYDYGDDEDMGGDYDAEQYFDGGEGDDDDGGDGGGDDY